MSQGYQQKCQKVPVDISPDTLSSIQQSLFSQLGITKTTCSMNSFNAAASASVSGPLGLGSGSLSGDINDLNKSGCGDAGIILQNCYNSIEQAKCALTNLGETSETTVNASQLISVKGGDNTVINAPPDADWTQDMNVTYTVYSSIGSTIAQTLSTIAQQGLTNTLNQLQANKNGYASTTSGSTLITDTQQMLSNKDTQDSITQNISKAIEDIDVSQNIIITGGNNSVINLPRTLDQNSIQNLQIAGIITSAYSGDIASQLSSFLKSSLTQKQQNTSGGLEDLFKAMEGNGSLYYIIGAIALIILGLIAIKFLKSKQGQKMTTALINKVPNAKK